LEGPGFIAPATEGQQCAGFAGLECDKNLDLDCILANPEMPDSTGTCMKRKGKKGDTCGWGFPSCADDLVCKLPPKNGVCGISQRKAYKSVGRKRCKNGGGAGLKEGEACANDKECGRGLQCFEISDPLGECA
jgi:hypothetical protein